ncbi:MAG: hypothetical protein K2Y01_05710 [Rhabdochlamydiaceae bacterium]|nr:hypothetical protein [Rhabdochlamydiaceae bacterium]
MTTYLKCQQSIYFSLPEVQQRSTYLSLPPVRRFDCDRLSTGQEQLDYLSLQVSKRQSSNSLRPHQEPSDYFFSFRQQLDDQLLKKKAAVPSTTEYVEDNPRKRLVYAVNPSSLQPGKKVGDFLSSKDLALQDLAEQYDLSKFTWNVQKEDISDEGSLFGDQLEDFV